MKRNLIIFSVLCLLISSIIVVQVGANERSYFKGCAECKGNVVAFCDGNITGSPFEKTHKYGGFLGIGANKDCNYTEYIHATTEYCQVDPTHVNPGDNVHAYRNHICGKEPNIEPCGINQVAYRSE